MKFLDGAIETWTLIYDDFAFVSEHPEPARLDLAVKLLSYRAFGRFFPYSYKQESGLSKIGEIGYGSSKITLYEYRYDLQSLLEVEEIAFVSAVKSLISIVE